MKGYSLKIGCSILVLAVLGACSSHHDDVVVTKNPDGTKPGDPSQLSSFGSKFAMAFDADPNSNPYTPADGDVPALTLLKDATPID